MHLPPIASLECFVVEESGISETEEHQINCKGHFRCKRPHEAA